MTASPTTHAASPPDPVQESPSFLVAARFTEPLAKLGLTSLDAVFAFESGRDLAKANIGRFRRRVEFEAMPAGAKKPVKVFLKRYDAPPALEQIRNWLSHGRRRSFASVEREAIERLAAAGVGVPRIVAWGEQWGLLFERRSFLMIEEIEDSRSLERRLPPCFAAEATPVMLRARRDFIREFGQFVRQFHETGHRHRDLYLCHIFCSDAGAFHLIDLARASRPILQRRYQVKDIAQLHYSAPAHAFSRSDRLRFYLAYTGRRRLSARDRVFLCGVVQKAHRMARHSRKHGTPIPFLGQ